MRRVFLLIPAAALLAGLWAGGAEYSGRSERDRYERGRSDRYERDRSSRGESGSERSSRGESGSERSSSSGPSSAASSPSGSFSERYAVLSERNIFARSRGQSSQRSYIPPPSGGPSRPERGFILTGVFMEEGKGYLALIEDARGGNVLRLQAGQSVAQGKVTRLDLSSIDYESSGRTTRVEVGMSLDGGVSSGPMISAMPTTNPSSSGSSSGSGGSINDVLERMRQRRMQEMGGK